MSMVLATGPVRFKLNEFDLNTIGENTRTYGKYVLITNKAICFHNQKIDGIQEYLIKQYKIANGIVVVKISESQFEVNVVKKSFIEGVSIAKFDSNESTIEIISQTLIEKLNDLIAIHFSDLKIKVVVNTRSVLLDESLKNKWEGSRGILICDELDAVPEKFKYVLDVSISKSRGNQKMLLVVSSILLAAIGISIYLGLDNEDTVSVNTVKEVTDPFKEYYEVLYGKIPSVRQQFWLAQLMLDRVDSLPDRRLKTLVFSQRPERNSMVISAELIPTNDDVKADLTSLISRVGSYEEGYMLDIQQQYPIMFRETLNVGVYDKALEQSSYDPITNTESNVGIYNIDKSLAYLRDAVNAIVPNVHIVIPNASESARVSNGRYQQREVTLSFEGNYKSDLEYLSIIFSGWPVVLVSGQLNGVDGEGRFTGNVALTILGSTN
ncbi:hypothetical protein OCF84_20825 (plasmid) [Shewanella xiamenensis]|uniref:Uncharacterized protein n=2 Tax=Shewanella xiamenensis TaxID=332186 RepID=A0ABT6UFP2_9GAMM|nr:hypothetical protein [Shewanella xiamenensis]MDI5833287.1 hypothetical protein [Shewanella xiamenensis]WHF57963.1 hypothetical protein OCF84_20825 [Shewanella xiamenensis]